MKTYTNLEIHASMRDFVYLLTPKDVINVIFRVFDYKEPYDPWGILEFSCNGLSLEQIRRAYSTELA